VVNFRNQYPEATFEQYYQWLRQNNQAQPQVQTQGQGFGQTQFEVQPQPTFNQMDMGLGQGAATNNGRMRPMDVLRQIDTGHFGQFVSQLN
jgi:hypothetical protein